MAVLVVMLLVMFFAGGALAARWRQDTAWPAGPAQETTTFTVPLSRTQPVAVDSCASAVGAGLHLGGFVAPPPQVGCDRQR
jgi:hypothetical protein